MQGLAAIVLPLRLFFVYLITNKHVVVISFKVERNYQDVFQNPDCLTTEAKCSPKACDRYNAGCPYQTCKSCQCSGDDETFITGNLTGGCTNVEKLVNFPG